MLSEDKVDERRKKHVKNKTLQILDTVMTMIIERLSLRIYMEKEKPTLSKT